MTPPTTVPDNIPTQTAPVPYLTPPDTFPTNTPTPVDSVSDPNPPDTIRPIILLLLTLSQIRLHLLPSLPILLLKIPL